MTDVTSTTATAGRSLDFRSLREANESRQIAWCASGDPVPDLSFRAVELAGEVGEVCNVVKKLERERHGWRGSRDTFEHLAEELADSVICADLVALGANIDLGAAVIAKFDATSEKVGLPQRFASAPAAGLAWVDPAPDASPSIMPTGKVGTLSVTRASIPPAAEPVAAVGAGDVWPGLDPGNEAILSALRDHEAIFGSGNPTIELGSYLAGRAADRIAALAGENAYLRARLAALRTAPAAPSRQDSEEEAECFAALIAHPLVLDIDKDRKAGGRILVILKAGAWFPRRYRSAVDDDMARFSTARDALLAVALATAAKAGGA